MINPHLRQRLAGLQTILKGVHQSGRGLSSATIGQERSAFINDFLSVVYPGIYRFGTGDATDMAGSKSGQLDVVIELPFAPSIPVGGGARLYLAEAVAAVIEVKSNVQTQWAQALDTAEKLAPLRRKFGGKLIVGPEPTENIPLFAVGYVGHQKMGTLKNAIDNTDNIYGALVIDPGLYYSKSGHQLTGELALWGLIVDIHRMTNSVQSAGTNPISYAER